ncbi:MAG: DUF4430 domain-containing protein [Lachnospiraceae bacterium]|jgi:hypothetical protein|nr:DUF4430 domain-containing protein [Lachnospiraceae bacterium]
MEQTKEQKNFKKILVGLIFLVLAILVLYWVYRTFMPGGQSGDKKITVKVIHGDQTERTFVYQTDEEYLGAVLKADKLAEGDEGQFGMFITSVDGEKADDTKQQWWCLTKKGEQVNTSADQTPISDGDTYELTLTEGY